MTVIAITNVPKKANMTQVVKSLVRVIYGQFEALELKQTKTDKICYIRLSHKLDPWRVVEKIKNESRYGAYVVPPDNMPKLPQSASKAGQIPARTRMALLIPAEDNPEQVLIMTHKGILEEMQAKFTGLFNLSNKTNHKLLDNIAQTVFERLKVIMETNATACESGFQLSKAYRRLHPHFGDFQLILSNLHAIQDAAGEPRTQLQESELTAVTVQPYGIENTSCDKVLKACDKYSQRIVMKIAEHISGLKSDADKTDTEEESARKRVRQELKKISPYLPMIVKQVISNHFFPPKSGFHRMRMYGEPFLPAKEQLTPLIKRHRAVKVLRSDRMYNLLRFNLPPAQCSAAMGLDGTVINGAKLVVRSYDIPMYSARPALVAAMHAVFGAEPSEEPCVPMDEE